MQIDPIAHIETSYPTKFGVPRQPGLVDALHARLVFEPAYRNPDAVRGLMGFDYVWLIWAFSHNESAGWSPTVRPPILGGTRRMGVFATRSSFRPNNLGLSSVRLVDVRFDEKDGPVLVVAGADMVDGTPVFDIKPYIPSSDAHPSAAVGWKEAVEWPELEVSIPRDLLERVPSALREGLLQVLRQDPRPAYTREGQEGRLFWVPLGNLAVRFTVGEGTLSVVDIVELDDARMRRLRETGTVEF